MAKEENHLTGGATVDDEESHWTNTIGNNEDAMGANGGPKRLRLLRLITTLLKNRIALVLQSRSLGQHLYRNKKTTDKIRR